MPWKQSKRDCTHKINKLTRNQHHTTKRQAQHRTHHDLQFTPQEKGDTIISHDGFNVFMDAKSMIYLKGMQLDYQDGLQGKGFVFVNPNATSTCGCGESFSIT